ncbi:MAG: FMN phosphatase YigB (HAD superfamily) [Natronomonas sp.]|uniref:HAD family hydrolase n=1 Tax=Natronomonas sp. TaxID=2184060 RepID=UPI003989A04A
MKSDVSRIETVLFDLDETLVQYERSPGEVLQASFETVGIEPLFSVEEYYARYDEFAERCDSMNELRSECFAALAAENGFERQLGQAVADTYSEERDQTNVELPPICQALDATPATAVHVGDSLETDIAGASAAGLDPVWISAGDDVRGYTPTHRIESIDGLLSFL